MGNPKKRRAYYCIRCGGQRTIKLEHDAKHSFTDRVLVHCLDCRNTFTVLFSKTAETKPKPPEGKPLYVLDACSCSTATVIRTLCLAFQDNQSVHFKSTCMRCGNMTRIRQPLDEIEDILEMQAAFDRFIESYESWGLMSYLFE